MCVFTSGFFLSNDRFLLISIITIIIIIIIIINNNNNNIIRVARVSLSNVRLFGCPVYIYIYRSYIYCTPISAAYSNVSLFLYLTLSSHYIKRVVRCKQRRWSGPRGVRRKKTEGFGGYGRNCVLISSAMSFTGHKTYRSAGVGAVWSI